MGTLQTTMTQEQSGQYGTVTLASNPGWTWQGYSVTFTVYNNGSNPSEGDITGGVGTIFASRGAFLALKANNNPPDQVTVAWTGISTMSNIIFIY